MTDYTEIEKAIAQAQRPHKTLLLRDFDMRAIRAQIEVGILKQLETISNQLQTLVERQSATQGNDWTYPTKDAHNLEAIRSEHTPMFALTQDGHEQEPGESAPTQQAIWQALAFNSNKPMGLAAIADQSGLSETAIDAALQRMKSAGLVERIDD